MAIAPLIEYFYANKKTSARDIGAKINFTVPPYLAALAALSVHPVTGMDRAAHRRRLGSG